MVVRNLKEMLVEKCEIYYGDALISKETIIEEYASFFSEMIVCQEHSVSCALHTGSKCFDFVSIVAATLGCFVYSDISNDEIVENLKTGDIVIYEGKRYRWVSSEYEIHGEKYMVMEQDGNEKNINPKKYVSINRKYRVKPYYGESKTTDGRGIRKKKPNRESFLSYVLDIPLDEIPSITKIAVVIVAERNDFSEIYKNIKIVYDQNKQISLSDIAPAAYYTASGEKYQYGENPTRAEPIIKVVGNIAAARNIVLDRNLNRVVGLIIMKDDSLTEKSSELADLLRRKSINFVHFSVPFKLETCENIFGMYEDVKVYACTKDYLIRSMKNINNKNSFTLELQRQVSNIINCSVSKILLDGGWYWEEYKQIKHELSILRKSSWSESNGGKFVLLAYGLLNLFTTANFSMEKLEKLVEQRKAKSIVESPKERILKMWKMAENAGIMQERCIYILDAIEKKYRELQNYSPKEEYIYSYLKEHTNEKILIVAPKAYYIDVFYSNKKFGIQIDKNINCVSVNQFNADKIYDAVLVLGDIVGKRFNPLQCRTARTVNILLYDCEERTFDYRQHEQMRFEQKLNLKIHNIEKDNVALQIVNLENSSEIEDKKYIKEFYDLQHYIESINLFDIRKLMTDNASRDINAAVSEVMYIGLFTTGEQIFFSQYYSPVVFDYENKTVIETTVDKLVPGKILVFTKWNNFTKNIVDEIYEKLILSEKLNPEIINASEKVSYWKKILGEYKDRGQYTYRAIAKQLENEGCARQAVTVRQWLMEDSHIVGPNDVKAMEAIAKITQDKNLLRDTGGYFKACKIVRRERRSILKLIENAINDRLRGYIPPKDSILKVVYDNVDNFAEMYELECISKLEDAVSININLVNKPIMGAEVLL